MFFFTHLYMSKALHRNLSREIALDRGAFAFGNIKPDLPSPNRVHHTLENCIQTVCTKSEQLMEGKADLQDFSVTLGEICHYTCDFFCYYHLSEKLHNRKLRHLFYEIGLHLELFRLRILHKQCVRPVNPEPRKDVRSIVDELRREYFSKPRKMKKDIDYALSAAMWVSKSILYYIGYTAEAECIEAPVESQSSLIAG